MQSSSLKDAQNIRRITEFNDVGLDPEASALVILSDVEVQVLDSENRILQREHKKHQKKIVISSVNEYMNVTHTAEQIVADSNGAVPRQKIGLVEQRLRELIRARADRSGSIREQDGSRKQSSAMRDVISKQRKPQAPPRHASEISKLSEYMEKLYDTNQDIQNEAAAQILELAQVSDNLVTISNNFALLNALKRLLQEKESRKTNLAQNIIFIFFCISH
ncbi:MAG: hypothetical protein EZS28_016494, partial [Streblomastix strix]